MQGGVLQVLVFGAKIQPGWKMYRMLCMSCELPHNICHCLTWQHKTRHMVAFCLLLYTRLIVGVAGLQYSHKNKRIILQRIRERGHARRRKNLDPSDETHTHIQYMHVCM